MSSLNYIPISNGIHGLFIENKRFSTTHVSVNFYLPLIKEKIAANALLPYVLSSCCGEYPDFSALNFRLNELYGAEIGGIADKIGDTQVIRFFSYCIDNEYVPTGEDIASKSFNLLLSMLFEPSVSNGEFKDSDVERERRLTLQKIEGIINDKRTYAINRTLFEMYKDDPFGQLKTGSAEDVAKVTAKDLYETWKDLLASAEIRIQVVGKELPTALFEMFKEKISKYQRQPVSIKPTKLKTPAPEVKRICEKMDITQGKMVMGFCTDITGTDRETAYLAVFADLFGGGPYSKLFVNVREKMSLCYYCAARANRTKGYMLVDCGIETQNAQKAEEEILNQLERLKSGDFTDEELNSSKRSIKDSLICINDSQAAIDSWYSSKTAEADLITPEEYNEFISGVTREDIIKAAKSYSLDTVYKIMPR